MYSEILGMLQHDSLKDHKSYLDLWGVSWPSACRRLVRHPTVRTERRAAANSKVAVTGRARAQISSARYSHSMT